MNDDDPGTLDFHDALGALHSLVLGVADVEAFLTEVADLAAAAVETEVACGITTRYDHNPVTAAASDPRAAIVDEQQYGAGQGPCLEALSTGLVVDVPDQSADHRWGPYRDAAVGLGVKCSLSLPLFVDDSPVGALNLYGFRSTHAFGQPARHRAEVFAAQASTALTLALRFNNHRERSRQLMDALYARSVIDQALGILMVQQKCDAQQAFDLLRRRSQSANRKLHDVAAEVVERASGHPLSSPAPFEDVTDPGAG
ncbi:MAG: GAF and ANTAR domain-containing protein [Nocardioides sp.]|uniref:GAF and ANTAR domain-containing protein n=1 Tax=Nocardioides sp. TaxID=35761 RepID=UPI0032643B7C